MLPQLHDRVLVLRKSPEQPCLTGPTEVESQQVCLLASLLAGSIREPARTLETEVRTLAWGSASLA